MVGEIFPLAGQALNNFMCQAAAMQKRYLATPCAKCDLPIEKCRCLVKVTCMECGKKHEQVWCISEPCEECCNKKG